MSTHSNTIQKKSVSRLSIPPFLFKSSAHPVPTTTKIHANTAHTQKNLFFKLKKEGTNYHFLRKPGNHTIYMKDDFAFLCNIVFAHLKSNISTAVVNAPSFNVDTRSDKYLGSLS